MTVVDDAKLWGISESAARLHRAALVGDFTLPYADIGSLVEKARVLPRFRKSGVDFVSLTVSGAGVNSALTLSYIAKERRKILNDPETYVLVETAADILRAKAAGKMAVMFHFQGTGPIDNRLEFVETFYHLGVKHMLLAYNNRNRVGDGCMEPEDGGLSRFGHALIAEMNRVGMIVDCAHTGYRTSMNAMAISKDPVIFSHANPKAICDHPRNIADDQIKACAASGGVVGILGISNMMGPGADSSTDLFIRHIDYCVDLVGIDHVGISLDFVYDLASTYVIGLELAGGKLPEDGRYSADMPIVQPEQFPHITEGLLKRGYKDDDILKILGQNWLRICDRVWK